MRIGTLRQTMSALTASFAGAYSGGVDGGGVATGAI
jgi:hypothetical protein